MLLLPVVSATVPSLVSLLVLRSPIFAVLFGISFPLAAWGAEQAGIGKGVVLGMLNGVWALANVIGPLAGGALAQLAGRSAVYLVLMASRCSPRSGSCPRRPRGVAREADDEGDWAAAGCSSSAQWLAQISRSDHRSAVRITRTSSALRELPALDHALGTGR